jgi:hypothetical protein
MPCLNSMLFWVVTYVGSCLPMIWDSLLAPVSRVTQSKKIAGNRRMYGYIGDGVPCRTIWDWPYNLHHTKILSTKYGYMNWLVREARIGAPSQQYEQGWGPDFKRVIKISHSLPLRMQKCTPPPSWLIWSCFLSLKCLFSYPLALSFSIIHWVHSSNISPSSLLQLVIFIFAPLCFLFFLTFPYALTFCLPFFLSVSCIQALLPVFILPLLSEVFHFWHLCSFSSVTLVSPPSTHAPTCLVRLLSLRTNQHPHHLLYINMLPPVPGIILRLLDPWRWDQWAVP